MTVLMAAYLLSVSAILVGYLAGYVLILRHAGDDGERADAESEQLDLPPIDVILPVKNEYSLVGDKLNDLARQSYPAFKMNIILVDSSEDTRIEELIAKFVREHRLPTVTFIKDLQRVGKAHALNLAFKASRREICVITDVDVRMDSDGLVRLVRNFARSSVGAVSGMETLVQDVVSSSRTLAMYRGYYNSLRMGESNVDSVVMCESELAAYRRRLLEELDERTQSDDIELTISVRRKGFRAIYDPHVKFYEIEGFNRWDTLRRKLRRARANIYSLIKNIDLTFDAKLGSFGTIIFPFELFSNVVSPILLIMAIGLLAVELSAGTERFFALAAGAVFVVGVVVAGGFLSSRGKEADNVTLIQRGITFLFSFVEYNLILLLGLVLVLTRGSQPSWKSDLRRAGSVTQA